MNKIKIFILSISACICLFASCDETVEPGDYDNWQERNIAYIDSIATVAAVNADGTWKVFPATGLVDTVEWADEYYVYCKVLQAGDGEEHPDYNDTVLVNYSGRLIPTKTYPEGYIFDSSYDGKLEPEFDVPVELPLAETVKGFYTALQQMVAGKTLFSGDIWRVYIPANLGYAEVASSTIPAYSTLIFDINLVSFHPASTPQPK